MIRPDKHRWFFLIVAAACLPPVLRAAEPPKVACSSMVAAMQPFVDQQKMGGAVMVVATKDDILCLDTVGYADFDAKTPMWTDSFFWIASMTKPMSTSCILMLADEGKLNINDPVEKYLPEFKNLRVADANGSSRPPSHPITIKELLSHTHGLGEAKSPHTNLQADVDAFVKIPMLWDPSTKYKYSGGITVGARILEVVSGMSYADFIQQRLFTPLGMTEATFWPNKEQVARLARSYRRKKDNSGIENVDLGVKLTPDQQKYVESSDFPADILLQYNASSVTIHQNKYAGPSGGIFCTAAEVTKFGQMLLNGGGAGGKRILSARALAQLTANQTGPLVVSPNEAYGLGFSVQTKGGPGRANIGSFGHRGARKTMLWVDPKTQIVMILLTQSFDLSSDDQNAIYSAFIDAAEKLAPVPAAPGDYLAQPDAWYSTPEAKQIADNILSYQSPLGGWPKNVDTTASPYVGAKTDIAPTFDNRATSDEMRYLARMFAATPDDRYRAAFLAGLDYILKAQYPAGGWPQSYPIRPQTYHRHITFNDDAMVRILLFLQEITKSPRYEFVPIERRTATKDAFDRGIDCILKCQIVVNGKKTVWCAQHDELDYQPRKGRWHELPSLSGAESLGILRLLMSIEQPKPEIVQAVDAAAVWYQQSKIVGYRIEQHPDAKELSKFRTAIPDAAAPPLWARMYDIATNQPLVAGMDSVPHLGMNEIGYGRPGYQWFGEWPKRFLDAELPAWKHRLNQQGTRP